MRHFRFLSIGVIAIAMMATSATAQKKPVKKPAPKKPTAASTKIVPPLDVRTAREKVDIQLANVTQFVDVMGPIVQGIETLDQSARTKKLPKATIDRNELTKQKVVEAIQNLRAGLLTLESEFRTKPTLQKYLINIDGISDLVAQAEDTALAGKYVESKEPLRDVAKKLTDTLAAMPL